MRGAGSVWDLLPGEIVRERSDIERRGLPPPMRTRYEREVSLTHA